ncbi:MAG: S-adenosylmethionine decarboxylase [Acidobacteriota bacterium]
MNTRSRQLILDVWLDQPLNQDVVDAVLQVIRSRTTVLEELNHNYPVQGQTQVFILSESHFVFHSYPEHDYFTADLYVCNETTDLEGVADEILSRLLVKDFKREVQWRGLPTGVSPQG